MDDEKVILEARARIIWGEASWAVRDFLIANAISSSVAEAKLKEFQLERDRELRKIGLRNVLVGFVLSGAAGAALYVLVTMSDRLSSSLARTLALTILPGLYGVSKLVKGIIYLVRPQSEHGSIPDIGQSEIIE